MNISPAYPINVTADCGSEVHTPARCNVTYAQPGGIAGEALPSVSIRGEDGAMTTRHCATLADALTAADWAWLIHADKAQRAREEPTN